MRDVFSAPGLPPIGGVEPRDRLNKDAEEVIDVFTVAELLESLLEDELKARARIKLVVKRILNKYGYPAGSSGGCGEGGASACGAATRG